MTCRRVDVRKMSKGDWLFGSGVDPLGPGITNIAAIPLPKEMVRIITTEAVRHQLQLVIGFVYASHAIECVGRIAFEECFNKLLKGLNR